MSGVVIELGAGAARVGSAQVSIAPADGGTIRVGEMLIAPLSFADRSRLVAEARSSGTTGTLGAAVLARACAGLRADTGTDAATLEAIALHLAGARYGASALPGFASALVALTCGAGWSPAAAVGAPADLVDRLAETILTGVTTGGDDAGWTRVLFTPDAAPPAEQADPRAVRDQLVADLVRRDTEGLTPQAAELAQRSAHVAAGGPRGTEERSAPAAEPTGAASARAVRTAGNAPTADEPPDPAMTGVAGREAGGAHASGPRLRSGSEAPGEERDPSAPLGFPEPIASGAPWPAALHPPRTAPDPRAHGAREARTFGFRARPPADLPALGRIPVDAPSSPTTTTWEAAPRSALPGLIAGAELDSAPDDAGLLVLSDALGAALDEECDLHGLEES